MALLRGTEADEHVPPRRQFGAPPPGGVTAQQEAPFGWAPLVILVAVGIVDAMESRIIGGALQVIIDEFGISDAAAGAIPTAVTIAGAIVTLPAGYLADRYNRTNLMALVVASWAVLLVGTALAMSFAFFFAMRVVLGAADSIDNPASGSLLGDYYPPLTRAKVFGWARLTTYAGGAIGTVYGAIVADLYGWRWAYALMVIPGVVCAWLCWRMREPVRGFIDQITAQDPTAPVAAPPSPDDTPVRVTDKLGEVGASASNGASSRPVIAGTVASAATVLAFAAGVLVGRLVGTAGSLLGLVAAAGVVAWCVLRWDRLTDLVAPLARTPAPVTDEAASARAHLKAQLDFKQQVKDVLQIPTLRLVTLGLMAMAFGLGGIVYWVPTLMHRNFGIAVGTAGTVSGLVSLAGLIGGTMYGGRLGRLWHGTRKGGRLLAGGGGLLIGSLLLGAALAQPSLAAFAVVLMVSTGFMALALPNLMASVADVLLATSRGIGFSMLQFLVAGAGAWSPLIVGAISDATGSLVTGMYALVAPGALSGVLVLMARRHFDDDAGRVLDAARQGAEE